MAASSLSRQAEIGQEQPYGCVFKLGAIHRLTNARAAVLLVTHSIVGGSEEAFDALGWDGGVRQAQLLRSNNCSNKGLALVLHIAHGLAHAVPGERIC